MNHEAMCLYLLPWTRMYGAVPSLCCTSVGCVSQLNTGRNVPGVSIIIAVLINM